MRIVVGWRDDMDRGCWCTDAGRRRCRKAGRVLADEVSFAMYQGKKGKRRSIDQGAAGAWISYRKDAGWDVHYGSIRWLSRDMRAGAAVLEEAIVSSIMIAS